MKKIDCPLICLHCPCNDPFHCRLHTTGTPRALPASATRPAQYYVPRKWISLYAGGVGPMPVLLSTNQIDGYIAWQPFVSVATDAKIGQLVTYSQNFPPDDKWNNHPCCVLTARDDLIPNNPDFVNAMAAQTILADKWITDHPDQASADIAEWSAGSGNLTVWNVTSLSLNQVLKDAIPTVQYTTDPTPQWINQTKDFVNTQIASAMSMRN